MRHSARFSRALQFLNLVVGGCLGHGEAVPQLNRHWGFAFGSTLRHPSARFSIFVCRLALVGAIGISGLAFVALPSFGYAAEPSTNVPATANDKPDKLPPPLKRYKGRTIAPYMTYEGAPWLVRESRAKEESTDKLLEVLGIEPGQVVCDMGCGNGYYTLELAQRVGPKGRVLAVDIQPEMLHLLSLRLQQAGITNVELIQGTLIDPKLPPAALDLILLVDVYHEFSYPEQMLAAMRKSLKPTGRIVLVEFRAEDFTVPIKPLHKMSKRQVLKELVPNGYKLVDEFNGLSWQHVLFFGKADEPPADEEPAAEEKSDRAAKH